MTLQVLPGSNQVEITINAMLRGRSNNANTFTLAANATTTTVTDNQFESSMVPVLTATTAHAAAELATLYVSARDKGQFTLTHSNAATTDRTYLYTRQG